MNNNRDYILGIFLILFTLFIFIILIDISIVPRSYSSCKECNDMIRIDNSYVYNKHTKIVYKELVVGYKLGKVKIEYNIVYEDGYLVRYNEETNEFIKVRDGEIY